MEIDIRTLILIHGVSRLIEVLVFFYQYMVNKSYRGIGWWVLWGTADAIGLGAMLLRTAPSLLPYVTIVQNFMFVTGAVFLFIGVRRFFDKPMNLKLLLPLVSLYLAGLLYFLFITDDIQIRSGLFNGTLAIISLLTAQTLFINKIRYIKTTAYFNAILFLLHGSIFVFRIIILVAGSKVDHVFSSTMFYSLPFLDVLIISLLWTFGLIIMVNQRLNAEMSETKEDLRLIFNTSPDAASITRMEDGHLVDMNDEYLATTGYTREELIGKTTTELNIWKDITDRQNVINFLNEQGYCENYEACFVRKDGVELTGLMSAKMIKLQGVPHLISITRDITQRKVEEEKLRKSEAELKKAQETGRIGSWGIDMNGAISGSDELYRIFEVPVGTFFPDIDSIIHFIHPDDRLLVREWIRSCSSGEKPGELTYRILLPGGLLRYLSCRGELVCNADGTPVSMTGTMQDITERKESEEKILQASRVYAVISQINQAIVRLRNRDELFKESCRIAVEYGSFQLAWIGIADVSSSFIQPVAFAGQEGGYLTKIKKISLIDGVPEGLGPTGTAIREKKHVVCNDIENDPMMAIWRDEAIKLGYRSSIALPIIVFGNAIGTFNLYSNIQFFFNQEEISLLDEVINDLGFAIEAYETEEKRKQAVEALFDSELKYRNLVELLPEGIVVHREGIVIFANSGIARILGEESPSALIGKPVINVVHPDYREAVVKRIKKSIAENIAAPAMEEAFIKKDGTKVVVEVAAIPFEYEGKKAMLAVVTDITLRKQVEEQISMLAHALRSIGEGVSITDKEDKLLYVNPVFLKMYHYEEHELIGKNISMIRSPNNPPNVIRQILPGTLAGGWQGEIINRRKDGGDFPVFLSTSIVRDENNEPLALIGVSTDITERRKVEEALRNSEEQYRSLFENMLEGWAYCRMMFDDQNRPLDFEYIAVNKAFSLLTGLNDVVGRRGTEVMPGPGDVSPELLEIYGRVALTGQPERFEFNFKSLSIWLSISVYSSKRGYFVEVFDNITERKLAENALKESIALYKLLSESTRDVVWLLDMNLNITYISPSIEKLRGYTLAEIGQEPLEKHVTPESYLLAISVFEEEMAKLSVDMNYSPSLTLELEFKRKDGSTVWLESTFSLLRDENGMPVSILGEGRDITERRQIQEEIKQLNADLEQRVIDRTTELQVINKELEAFSYSVSHDLRAPLRAIDGFTSILMEDYHPMFDDEGKQLCGKIKENTQRMGQLIDDLLAFSRLGRRDITMSRMNMKALAGSVFKELTTAEMRRHIDFKVGELDPVPGDRMLLQQVWTNLIANAIKFSSHVEQPEIRISSSLKKNKITYCVKDNGAGFDMKYAHKLFGVFQRLHSIKEFDGTGVGLAIVQRIISKHGGEVWAEGEIGKGASFYFSLPVKGRTDL
jgi:PAS domain S-box-containing protein